MRGKVSAVISAVITVGITPAYAGKRYVTLTPVGQREDHPCVCGEKR